MKVVFMGSPDFAVPCLEAVAARHEIALVVTQPDKPAGRGGAMAAPAVKVAAQRLGLPLFQPTKVRPPEVAAMLAETGAELGVVVAYGRILPPAILTAFPRGCINVHGSLLPAYRGAAPIQWAVLDGRATTGVTIMQLDEGMDTGAMLLVRELAIGADETAGELFARLAPLGASALVEALDGLAAGTIAPRAQPSEGASHARMLTKEDGAIDFARPAAVVAAHIRGVDPWPGAYAAIGGQIVKLFGGRAVEAAAAAPGTVIAIDAAGAHVACADGAVVVRELQLPARKRLPARELANGRHLAVGDVLAQAGRRVTAPRSARALARRVFARVDREGAWATLALAGELEHSGLDARDRRLATELVYGTLRHQRRLERALAAYAELKRAREPVRDALLVAAYQLLFLRVPPHAAVDDAVEAVRPTFGPKVAGFVNAVLRKLAQRGEPPLPDEPRARLPLEHSLAPWIIDELAAQLPADELAAAAAALKAQAPLWIRVNATRATTDDVIAALTAEGAGAVPSPLAPHALAVDGLGDPAASPSFRAGLWTVQDLGAQLVGLLASPAPGATILDACAGVGGKTTHLAELARGAIIDAVDPQAAKLALLARSAARLGLSGLTTHAGPLAELAGDRRYDLVVVDAPCTGAGVLRRHPEAANRLRADDVRALTALQRELLDAAAARVRPGGALVYAVCTITAAEGPAQLAGFLARHADFALAPATLPIEVLDGGALRTWPHRHGADGFFAARLVRAP